MLKEIIEISERGVTRGTRSDYEIMDSVCNSSYLKRDEAYSDQNDGNKYEYNTPNSVNNCNISSQQYRQLFFFCTRHFFVSIVLSSIILSTFITLLSQRI